MANLNVKFGGGVSSSAAVTATSAEIVPTRDGANNRNRGYLYFKADPLNAGPVFLNLEDTASAVVDTGVAIFPGETYELTSLNMYLGAVQAISRAAQTNTLYIYEGF